MTFWDPVVERVGKRLDGWKRAFLSRGGKFTAIHSVLSSPRIYFLFLLIIPVIVALGIEKLRNSGGISCGNDLEKREAFI